MGYMMASRVSFSRVGFLLTAFLFPGLIGTFASYSIPAPVIDAMHQEAALDAVLAAQNTPNEANVLANLDNDVDQDTAAIVNGGNAPLAKRVAAARANMRLEVVAEARAEAYRIRLMVITMTILGAIFGVALLSPGGKASNP
jgi:hypothetical protein